MEGFEYEVGAHVEKDRGVVLGIAAAIGGALAKPEALADRIIILVMRDQLNQIVEKLCDIRRASIEA